MFHESGAGRMGEEAPRSASATPLSSNIRSERWGEWEAHRTPRAVKLSLAEDPDPVPDRVDHDPDYDPLGPIICEVCGSPMRYLAGCKIVCGNCGYRRDCSDP